MENYLNLFTQTPNSPVLLLISFLGGVLASLSPCSLAILPIIIGYVVGYSKESTFKTFLQMIFFIFGMSIVFSVIGIICALTGKVFMSFGGAYFALIISSLILVMGLKLVGILDFEMPVIIKQMPQNTGNNIVLYPIMVGAVFALAGTPCSTPILAAIMGVATLTKQLLLAVLMLFLFSIGQGVIIVFAGVLFSKIKQSKGFSVFSEILMKLGGILLILGSLYIFYKIFAPYIVK